MKDIYQSYYTKSITSDKILIYIKLRQKYSCLYIGYFFKSLIRLIDFKMLLKILHKKVYAPFYPLTIFV